MAGFAGGGYVYATSSTTNPARQSADSGASWTGVAAPNRGTACGNGTTTALLSHSDGSGNGGFISVTGSTLGTSFGTGRSGSPFTGMAACALSADGQIVYVRHQHGEQIDHRHRRNVLPAAPPPGGGLMSVSADGKRLVYGSAWSETGGE